MGQRRKRGEQQERCQFLGAKKNQVDLQGVGGGAMVLASLHHHMERTHGIVLPHTRGVDVGGGGPETYVVYFTRVLKLVAFLLDG